MRRASKTGSAETEGRFGESCRIKSKTVVGLVFSQQHGPSVWDVFFLARREAEIFWLPSGVSSQGPQRSSWEDRAPVSVAALPSEGITGGRQEAPKPAFTPTWPSAPRQRTAPSPTGISTVAKEMAVKSLAIILVVLFSINTYRSRLDCDCTSL